MSNASFWQKYPLFRAFCDKGRSLPDDRDGADVHARIRSIGGFMVRKVTRFYESLKSREKANCDPEDLLIELYIMLVEKDGHWNPERGKYITYAGKLIHRELLAIRDRSRTVQSPRNATSRLKEYQASEMEGKLSDRRRETYGQLSRTVENARSMPSADLLWLVAEDHVEEIEHQDAAERRLQLVARAIKRLGPVESCVIGWASGLWGSGSLTHQEIADKTRLSVEDVREIKAAAHAKIRWYVNSRMKRAGSAV